MTPLQRDHRQRCYVRAALVIARHKQAQPRCAANNNGDFLQSPTGSHHGQGAAVTAIVAPASSVPFHHSPNSSEAQHDHA